MAPQHGALVVFGSGPGIGRNVASYFAEQGFSKVVLLSRDENRLKEDVEFVRKAAPSVSIEALPIDLADLENVRAQLKILDKRLGVPLEAVLFNAARVGQSKILEWRAEELERDLRISVASLLEVAQWAMPQLVKFAEQGGGKPSFLVTSGGLYKDPFPAFFSLASCKAAQFNFVHSLHKEFGPKGVHCAAIVVEGKVNDEAKVTTARNIAKEAWKLCEQKAPGDLSVEIVDPDYKEFISKNS